MSQRSTPQAKIDDRAFPIRMFVAVPEDGFGRLLGPGEDSIHAWLDREVGRGDYAIHGGARGSGMRDRVAVYLRTAGAAVRFLATFPQLELVDGTMSATYHSPTFPFGRR